MKQIENAQEKLPTSRALLILLFMILIGIILRTISFGGYSGSDDGSYTELAYRLANEDFSIGGYDGPPVFLLRVALIAPVALFIKLFGLSEFSIIFYPFLISIFGILLAFLVGWKLFNTRVGLLAAAIQSVFPIDVRLASIVLPDLPGAFWANVSLFTLYIGSRQTSTNSKVFYGILSGITLGIAWLCKESVIYLFPLIGVYLLWLIWRQRQNLSLCISFGLFFLAIFSLESLAYYRITGDYLFRFHEIGRNYIEYKAWFFSEGSNYGWKVGDSYWMAVAKRVFWHGPKTIFFNLNFGLVPFVAMVVLICTSVKRSYATALIILWFLYLVFMFNFGTTSFKFYQPLALLDRYLFPIFLPAIILTAAMIDSTFRERIPCIRQWKGFGEGIMVIVLTLCLFNVGINVHRGTRQSSVERKVSRILSPEDQIYTDSRTPRVLKFFWSYPKNTHLYDFSGMDIKNIPINSYVLINRSRADFLNSWYGYKLPLFYRDIPKNWFLEWADDGAELYYIRDTHLHYER